MKHFLIFFSLLFLSCSSLEIKELEKATIFTVNHSNNTIVLNGVINSSALDRFKGLSEKHTDIKRIEIINCEGSINDEVNLALAKYVYENNFTIHLNTNGLVASGGTDFFLAGKNRTKGKNTKIGVHSWAGNDKVATDFPKGHKYHLPYIAYYKSVGFTQQEAEDFYYFTINAAPDNDIHWMTDEELKRYKIVL